MADTNEATAAAERENAALEANSPLVGGISASERAAAQKEGIREAVKENAKSTYKYVTDGANLSDAEPARQWPGSDDIMRFEGLLDLAPDAFEDAISKDPKEPAIPIPEEKVYGLLGLERNGRNRTLYVKPMMKRLGIKADELPPGGLPYTNDAHPITDL